MPPENTPPPPTPISPPPGPGSGPNDVKIIAHGHVHGPKTLIIIVSILVVLGLGIGAAVYIGQSSERGKSEAWDCGSYVFNVTRTGQVTVTNNSIRNEPAQKVSVTINGQPVSILDVPKLNAGDTVTLGQVTVPDSGAFTWSTQGTSDCSNQGSYQALISPTLVPPTATPEITPPDTTITPTLPATTISPTVTPVAPTATITLSPTATVTPNPTSPPSGQLNTCNGTCGSDANCQVQYVCSAGHCRNPSCSGSESCACAPPPPAISSTPIPTPIASLPKTGVDTPTWIMSLGGIFMIGLGALLVL